MDNLDFLYGLFNQYLFSEAKANIENLDYYFRTNARTSGSPLVEELVNAIRLYELNSIDIPLFRSILNKCKKTDAECEQILNQIITWKTYNKEQMLPVEKYLRDIVASAIVQKARSLFEKSPSEYLKYLKTVNFQGDIETFSSTSFDKIDINSIIADSGKGAISTNVRLINDAFAPLGGIERGQIGIVSCSPGVGKTLFSMNLALWMASQGEKVLYISCADMNWKDFIVRMSAIAFGMKFSDVYANLGPCYENLKNLVGSNLEVSVNPAGTVGADDIIDKVMAGDYSVVFIDYDGVLKGVTEGDSMYNTFGEIYNNLTKLSMSGKLVVCCSQPKVTSYNKIIGLADIGESSKKQQVKFNCRLVQ